LFVVQVNNPAALASRGVVELSGQVGPSPLTQPLCERPYELNVSIDGVQDSVLTSTGIFDDCPPEVEICLQSCEDVPVRAFAAGELPGGVLQFSTPADATAEIQVNLLADIRPPR
jgi:hypothetical protein